MPATTITLSNYHLSFADEFNGAALDRTTWLSKYWWGGRSLETNGELQYFADETTALVQRHPASSPFKVGNGLLTITARPTPDKALSDGLPYISGLINSHGSFAQLYGYFEIRAKVPAGQGLWPSFWLLPANGDWPPEIDVFELLGHDPRTIYASAHWGTPQDHDFVTNTVATGVDLSAGFHTYGMVWEDDLIAWYLDGRLIASLDNPPDQFDQPMYLLAGMAVGGTWGGAPDASTRFPADYLIDYIRVYSAGAADAVLPPTIAADGAAWTSAIYGTTRNDSLKGTRGNDLIDGRAGYDTMTGSRGDDTYLVDHARDRVIEGRGDGIDTVLTTLALYTAPAYVENVSFSGSAAAQLKGNTLDNVLRGGTGGDRLDGGAGADLLYGGGGRDVFVLRNGELAGDRIMDFAAGDTIRFEGFGAQAVVTQHQPGVWSVSQAGVSQVFMVDGAQTLAAGTDYLFG